MDLLQRVRLAIYAKAVQGGPLPSIDDVATAISVDPADVLAAYEELARTHVVIVQPGPILWAAPPFAGMPTRYRVRCAGRSYYAPCAWDAFGVPAAMKKDALIDARCPQSGAPLAAGVTNGSAYGDGVVHLEVPARRFWDDIFYT